jgi:hypothetical protein
MRTNPFRTALALAVASLVAAGAAAQTSAPDRYVVVTYVKVLPGQDDAYRAFVNSSSKPLFKEMMAANPNLMAWSLASVMFQGLEHGGQYDYVAAAVYAGPPPEPGADMDAVFRKATGMAQADYRKKLATLRTVAGTEVLRRRAGTGGAGTFKEGDFRVVARLKIADGMGDEFVEMAQSTTQAMMKGRVDSGEMKSWSMWTRTFPAGAATAYDAMTVTYWKDLASAIKGPDAGKGPEIFAKAFPGRNYATMINNARDYTTLQERAIMQVVALVER